MHYFKICIHYYNILLSRIQGSWASTIFEISRIFKICILILNNIKYIGTLHCLHNQTYFKLHLLIYLYNDKNLRIVCVVLF